MEVIGIDASLTGTGVAIYDLDPFLPDEPRWSLGTFGRNGKNDDPVMVTAARIETLIADVRDFIVRNATVANAIICIEQPPFSAVGGKSHDRAGLWWGLITMLRRLGAEVIIDVNVAHVKGYLLGKVKRGEGGKDQMVAAAVRGFPDAPISNNNEADATVLAAIAARLAGAPIEGALTVDRTTAFMKIQNAHPYAALPSR